MLIFLYLGRMKRSLYFGAIFCSLFLISCQNNSSEHLTWGIIEGEVFRLAAPFDAQIMECRYKLGESVDSNSVLMVMDTADLHLRKQKLQEEIFACQARMIGLAQQTAPERAVLGNLYYQQNQLKSGSASPKEMEQVNYKIIHAKEELLALQYRLEAENEALMKDMRALEIEQQRIDRQIEQAILRAPFKVVISDLMADKEEFVAQAQPLMRLVNPDILYLSQYVNADHWSELALDQEVSIVVIGEDGRMIKSSGLVDFKSLEAKNLNMEEGEPSAKAKPYFAIRIKLSYTKGLGVGQRARIEW